MANRNWAQIKKRIPYCVTPNEDFYEFTSALKGTQNFEKLIDRKIIQLQKNGVDCRDCEEYLDALVNDYICQQKCKLLWQHSLKRKNLTGFFTRRASDKHELEQLLSEIQSEIENAETEYSFTEMLYNKHNPLGIWAEKKNTLETEDFCDE